MALIALEASAGLTDPATYRSFAARAKVVCAAFRKFLADVRVRALTVAGYGAAAKGSTFLNTCAATVDDIGYVADANPWKWGRFVPGTGIPIVEPARLWAAPPDYVVILPWNLKDEIAGELGELRKTGTRFVTAIPTLDIF
jgi:hypothetical protein